MTPRCPTLSVAIASVAVVTVMVLAGCGGSGHRTHRTPVATTAPATATVASRAARAARADTGRLVCTQDIDLRRPGATGLHVVLGVVALPIAPGYGALQTARTGMHGRLRLFAKTGLVIKPHATFSLVVPAALRRRMAIAWGNAGDPPPRGRFVVSDCGRGKTTGSKWLVYAGGYYVSHPACMAILVVADGRRRRVRIGLGAPCSGQKPPPQPTQN